MAGAGLTPQQLDAARQVAQPAQLSTDQKGQWNSYVDYLEKRGYKGNTQLDNRDTNLGQRLLNEYKAQNPHFTLTYEQIPVIQQGIQNVRNDFINRWKKGAQVEGVKTADDIMSNVSPVDGWLGSKTSSYKFPVADITHTNNAVANYGNDIASYDAAVAAIKSKK